MKNHFSQWKKAVYTVEAAVIVPLSVTMIALLIGYGYFVHQENWFRGAAYESAEKSVESGIIGKSENAGTRRMEQRVSEMPVLVGEADAKVTEGARVSVAWSGGIQKGYFGSLFDYSGEVTLVRYDPVTIKRLEYLIKSLKE